MPPILHLDFLRVFHFGLLFALYAIIQIGQGFTSYVHVRKNLHQRHWDELRVSGLLRIPERAIAATPVQHDRVEKMVQRVWGRYLKGVRELRLPVTYAPWPERLLDSVPARRAPGCYGVMSALVDSLSLMLCEQLDYMTHRCNRWQAESEKLLP